jgi:hypothetical protein
MPHRVPCLDPAMLLRLRAWRKNLEMIIAAYRIPYIATASLSYLPDLEEDKEGRRGERLGRA